MNKLDRYFVIYPYSYFGESIICTIKNINAVNNCFKSSTIDTLKSLGAWNKSKTPVFLCSDKVASVLGLDVDGDIALIKEA